jgi:hypothetical protein
MSRIGGRLFLLAISIALVSAVSSSAATGRHCGSVSYTIPHTGDHGHAALNNLTAVDVSCRVARSVARSFLRGAKPPQGWHASAKTVVMRLNGQAYTVSEEILTRGAARVTGDIAN